MKPFNTATLFSTHRLTHLSIFIAGVLFASVPARAMEQQPTLANQIIPMLIKAKKSFICDYPKCGKAFTQASSLVVHKRFHTGKKPFVCYFPKCGKAFMQVNDLTKHKRIHSGKKPYLCYFPKCGKAFTQAGNLAKHKRTHTGEKPFECNYSECGKAFTQSEHLARHKKTHTKRLLNGEDTAEETKRPRKENGTDDAIQALMLLQFQEVNQ